MGRNLAKTAMALALAGSVMLASPAGGLAQERTLIAGETHVRAEGKAAVRRPVYAEAASGLSARGAISARAAAEHSTGLLARLVLRLRELLAAFSVQGRHQTRARIASHHAASPGASVRADVDGREDLEVRQEAKAGRAEVATGTNVAAGADVEAGTSVEAGAPVAGMEIAGDLNTGLGFTLR